MQWGAEGLADTAGESALESSTWRTRRRRAAHLMCASLDPCVRACARPTNQIEVSLKTSLDLVEDAEIPMSAFDSFVATMAECYDFLSYSDVCSSALSRVDLLPLARVSRRPPPNCFSELCFIRPPKYRQNMSQNSHRNGYASQKCTKVHSEVHSTVMQPRSENSKKCRKPAIQKLPSST
jgi:hypothetical protein